MTKDEMWSALIATCPSFQPLYDELDDEDRELYYVVAGDFVRHVAGWDSPRPAANLPELAAVIENLVKSSEHYISEFAVIGLLESIQFEDELGPTFFPHLQPLSALFWESIRKFWMAEIPYIGADIRFPQPDCSNPDTKTGQTG